MSLQTNRKIRPLSRVWGGDAKRGSEMIDSSAEHTGLDENMSRAGFHPRLRLSLNIRENADVAT